MLLFYEQLLWNNFLFIFGKQKRESNTSNYFICSVFASSLSTNSQQHLHVLQGINKLIVTGFFSHIYGFILKFPFQLSLVYLHIFAILKFLYNVVSWCNILIIQQSKNKKIWVWQSLKTHIIYYRLYKNGFYSSVRYCCLS